MNRYKNTGRKNISAAILAGTLCLAVLTGCASSGQEAPGNASQKGSENVPESVADTDTNAQALDEGEARSLGEFSMQDITGKTYTEEMFKDYDLTMVNVFATWCSPCIHEIPDLEKLYQEMADQGVNLVGIILDAADGNGGVDTEAVEKAKLLAEQTGASYPFLIPDAGGLNGRLNGIQAVPETFFVDRDGRIIGETYTGSNDLDGWRQVVETERSKRKGAQP